MKWPQFMLSTSEFEKRFHHLLRHKTAVEEENTGNEEHVPDYLHELLIKGKKESVMVFNSAIYHILNDKIMTKRLQRFVASICCTLDIPLLDIQKLETTCRTFEQQCVLLLSLVYFMS